MPRAASTSKEKEKKSASPKPRARTAAKKKTVTRVSTKASPARAKAPASESRAKTRRRTIRRAAPEVADVQETASPEEAVVADRARKAPTKFAATAKQKKARQLQIVVVAGLMAIGVGASAAVGFTDSGQINVAQTIQERNERMANMIDVGGPVTVVPAPQNIGNPELPDGGLIGLQPAGPKPSIPKTAKELAAAAATSNATSSAPSADATSATTTASSSLPVVDNIITHSATTTVEAASSSSASVSDAG